MPDSKYTLEELLELAEIIGGKVAAGQLPPKNEFGQYLI